jgi:Amt family ammonium transporter
VEVANGCLAGLVGITAGCAFVDGWEAVLIGSIATFIVSGANRITAKVKLDDPISVIPVHGAAGLWGAFSVSLFAHKEYIEAVYGQSNVGR